MRTINLKTGEIKTNQKNTPNLYKMAGLVVSADHESQTALFRKLASKGLTLEEAEKILGSSKGLNHQFGGIEQFFKK